MASNSSLNPDLENSKSQAGDHKHHGTTDPDGDAEVASSSDSAPQSFKRKQKRNKPTLSCGDCVERKTKVCQLSYYSWIIDSMLDNIPYCLCSPHTYPLFPIYRKEFKHIFVLTCV